MSPVVAGVAANISKSLRQYLSNGPGKHEIKELQKNSHIGRCTQTAGSANVKVQIIFHGRNNITYSTNCKYRTAVTLYCRNVVCFRYIFLNSLHKDDNRDNNNNNNNNLMTLILSLFVDPDFLNLCFLNNISPGLKYDVNKYKMNYYYYYYMKFVG